MSHLAEQLASSLILSKEKVRAAIVDSCPVPMFIADAQGKWVYVNVHYQKLLRLPTIQVLDDGWKGTLTEACTERFLPIWDHLIFQKVSGRHLALEHYQGVSRRHTVSGFMDIGFVTPDSFVGWFVPICEQPAVCPLHVTLLQNITGPAPGCPAPATLTAPPGSS